MGGKMLSDGGLIPAYMPAAPYGLTAIFCLILGGMAVFRVPMDDPRFSMRWIVDVGMILALAGVIWKYANKWIAMFLLLALVSSVFPFSTANSTFAFRAVLTGVIWYALIVIFLPETSIVHLLNTICIIALCHIALLILQTLNLDPFFVPRYGTKDIPVGLMSNQNEVSALLAFCFPAFLREKWIWGIIPLIGGLLMSKSLGGIIAVGFGIIFYLAIKGHMLSSISLGFALLLFGGLFLFEESSFHARIYAWKHGLTLYKEHWLMGAGIGHWKVVLKELRPSEWPTWWKTAHNEYLQGIFEMGIGFAVIVG